MLDEAMVGLADSQALQQHLLGASTGLHDEGRHRSSTAYKAADTSVAWQPRSPKLLRRQVQTGSPGYIETPRKSWTTTKRASMTGTTAPFFESSSEPHFGFESMRSQKRKRSPPGASRELAEPLAKRHHSSDNALMAPPIDSNEVKKPTQLSDASSSPPAEIDPLIMQMFGSYVDFV
jgi:hypothetical protein